MSGKMMLDDTLSQALKLETVKVAAEPLARLQMVRVGAIMRSEHCKAG
jgi:hypothetical protein